MILPRAVFIYIYFFLHIVWEVRGLTLAELNETFEQVGAFIVSHSGF